MITASQLERLHNCPGGYWLPQIRLTSKAAERGTAIHEFLATVHGNREAAIEAVPEEWREFCELIDVDALPVNCSAEVAYSCNAVTLVAGCHGNLAVSRNYPNRNPGEPSDWFYGTADVVGSLDGGRRGFVADFFTGRAALKKDRQLDFLAYCIHKAHHYDTVEVEAIKIGFNGRPWRERRTLDTIDLAAIGESIRELAVRVGGARMAPLQKLAEGEHCHFCLAFTHCPAKTSMIRHLAGGDETQVMQTILPLSPETAGIAYERLQLAKSVVRRIEQACYAALGEFGELPLPNGNVLKKVIEPGNERITDSVVAVQLLRTTHGDAAVDECAELKVTKTSLAKGMRKIFGKGGLKAERDMLAVLRAHDACERSPTEKIVQVSKQEGELNATTAIELHD